MTRRGITVALRRMIPDRADKDRIALRSLDHCRSGGCEFKVQAEAHCGDKGNQLDNLRACIHFWFAFLNSNPPRVPGVRLESPDTRIPSPKDNSFLADVTNFVLSGNLIACFIGAVNRPFWGCRPQHGRVAVLAARTCEP
jgi:hypothetical protein